MEWFVVLVNTQNGQRVGVTQEHEGFEVIAGPFTEIDAGFQCKAHANELHLPEFDNNVDVVL